MTVDLHRQECEKFSRKIIKARTRHTDKTKTKYPSY